MGYNRLGRGFLSRKGITCKGYEMANENVFDADAVQQIADALAYCMQLLMAVNEGQNVYPSQIQNGIDFGNEALDRFFRVESSGAEKYRFPSVAK